MINSHSYICVLSRKPYCNYPQATCRGAGHWPSETSSSNSVTLEIHSVPKQVVSQRALNLKYSFRTCDLDVF